MANKSFTDFKWPTDLIGNPVVWLLTTIVVVIAASFLIPGPNDNPSPEVVRRIIPTEFESNIKTIDDIVKEENMQITREDDTDRFEEFLQVEQTDNQIQPLFEAVREYIDNDQLIGTDDDNAWVVYEKILTIDPENSEARSGQSKILNYFIDHAEMAIESGQYEQAQPWLAKLDIAQPGDELQASLRAEINAEIQRRAEAQRRRQEELERQEQITALLIKAREEAQAFTFDFDMVRDIYLDILQIEAENAEAKQGLISLTNKQLDNAEILVRANMLQRAEQLIAGAQENAPENDRLSGILLALEAKTQQYEQEKAIAQQIADNERRIADEKEKAEAEAREKAEAEAEATRQRAKDEEQARIAQQLEQQREQQAIQDAQQQSPAQPEQSASRQSQVVNTDTTILPKETSTAGEDAEKTSSTGSEQSNDQANANDETMGISEGETESQTTRENQQLLNGVNAYYQADYPQAFELLFPLAERGRPRAQFRIGMMYQAGRSVSIDRASADKWFSLALPAVISAAQNSVPWAQADLGTAYELGISLQQDFNRAAHWYELSAKQGYAGAQTNLGVLYANGDGVELNNDKAVYWLTLAADQGDTIASENLSIIAPRSSATNPVLNFFRGTVSQPSRPAPTPTNDK
ncbi:MAG: hypothetical protein GKR95_12710 [Gammaproteobacteria bacterium]|nr:hypothetical protein [Gammaproteobacteria bacterium]